MIYTDPNIIDKRLALYPKETKKKLQTIEMLEKLVQTEQCDDDAYIEIVGAFDYLRIHFSFLVPIVIKVSIGGDSPCGIVRDFLKRYTVNSEETQYDQP